MEDKLTELDSKSYHFDYVGFAEFKKVFSDLEKDLPYYRIGKVRNGNSREIFYDIPKGLLADAGIVLSKYIEGKKAYLNIRRLNQPELLKHRSFKYSFGQCELDDEPKDFAFKLASMVEKSFRMPFSADLESMIRQTLPFMGIDISFQEYELICGSGFRGKLFNENLVYKDLKSKKKEVERKGVTLRFPVEERPEKTQLLETISRHVKGLALRGDSRFEYALKLLYSEPANVDVEDEEEGDEEE